MTGRSSAVALAALLTIACVGAKEPAVPDNADNAAPRLTKVTLNINPTLTYAPLMIASDAGFFTQEGIDPELVSLDSNSAVAAAAAGKLDVLSAGIRSGVFNMMLKGVPLKIVADKGHSSPGVCAPEAFIATVGAARRIEAAGGSLRGERVALTRGGTVEFLIVRLLESRKLTTDDVVIVQMPQGSAASSRGKMDALRYISEPNLSASLAEGWAAVVASPEEVAPGHQTAVIVYGKRLFEDDPDLGHRFMRAYLRGVRRYNEGKTAENVATISRHTKLPPEIIRSACWTTISADGQIDPTAVQPFLEWALEQNYLDAAVTPALWWDPTFIESAAPAVDAAAPAEPPVTIER